MDFNIKYLYIGLALAILTGPLPLVTSSYGFLTSFSWLPILGGGVISFVADSAIWTLVVAILKKLLCEE